MPPEKAPVSSDEQATPSPKRSRLRRVLSKVGRAVLWTTAVSSGLVGAALVAIDTDRGRAWLLDVVEEQLDATLQGDFELESVESVGLSGIEGLRGSIHHEDGTRVLDIESADVRLNTIALLSSLLDDEGPIRLELTEVAIERLGVDVGSGSSGQPRIGEIFLSVAPAPEDPNARPVRVAIPSIEVGSIEVHGRLAPSYVLGAEVSTLHASMFVEPEGIRGRVSIERLRLADHGPIPGFDGSVRAGVTMDFDAGWLQPHEGKLAAAYLALEGTALEAPLSVRAQVAGERVFARVDTESVDLTRALASLEESPIRDGARIDRAQVEVRGAYPNLLATVNVASDVLDAEAEARVHIGDEVALHGGWRLQARDPQRWVDGVVPLELGVTGRTTLYLGADGPRGTFAMDLERGSAADIATPSVEIQGALSPERVDATILSHMDGARLRADAYFVRTGETGDVVGVDARLDVHDMGQLPAVPIDLVGRGTVRARAELNLQSQHVSGEASVEATGVSDGRASVAGVSARATFEGPLSDPVVHGWTRLVGARAEGIRFDAIEATVHGPVRSPRVSLSAEGPQTPAVAVSLSASLDGPPVLYDVAVALTPEVGEPVRLRADRVGLGDGVAVDGAEITGLGAPLSVSADATGQRLRVVAKTDGWIDIGRATDLVPMLDKDALGMDWEGRVALDVDLSQDAAGTQGRAIVQLEGGRFERVDQVAVEDIELGLDLTLYAHPNVGQRAMGSLDLQTNLGTVHVASKNLATLAGSPLAPASWQQAAGAVVARGAVDLSALRQGVASLREPIDGLEGWAWLHASVSRSDTEGLPELRVAAGTRELALTRASEDGSFAIDGVDVMIGARVDSDEGSLGVATMVFDGHGAIAQATLTSEEVTEDRILRGLDQPETLFDVPFSLDARIPDREIAGLPAFLGLPQLEGALSATVAATGPLRRPELTADARLTGLSVDREITERSFDATLRATYREGRADADLTVGDGERTTLEGNAQVELSPSLWTGQGPSAPWAADVELTLLGQRLQALRPLAERNVQGLVRGHVRLTGLNRDASLDADVRFEDIVVDGDAYDRLGLRATIEDGKAQIWADGSCPQGTLKAEAKAPVLWGARVVPELGEGAVKIHLSSKRFPIDFAHAVVPTAITEVGGDLDADVEAEVEPSTGAWKAKGHIQLQDGALGLAALGEPFEEIELRTSIDPNGKVSIERLAARSGGGRLLGSGHVQLRGTGFEQAQATIRVDEEEAIPIVTQGLYRGQFSGLVHVEARQPKEQGMVIDVRVPSAYVKLPYVDSNEVTKLEPAPDVRIGMQTASGFESIELVPPDEDAQEEQAKGQQPSAPIRIQVELSDIRVEKPDTLQAFLSGSPTFVIGQEVTASGRIDLEGGDLTVQGRRFELEGGTVTFTGGEPGNPSVVATASWEAPDGTTVYADFVGPLQTGKVTLRSQPALSRQEILSLIAFGSVDGLSAQGQGQQADRSTQAVGLTGGYATQGLNAALDDITSLDVRTRVDTSSSANPRPEVEVMIARDISVAIAHVLGTPAPGSAPDKNYASVMWRFAPRWSLETTFGDQGSSAVDVLWRLLY